MATKFSERNRVRCESQNGFNHALGSWSLSDWMTAVAGEVGEAANIIKKLNRVRDGIPGNRETPDELRTALAEEIADTAIYLDLLAQAAGFDLEKIVEAKFAKTSAKIGYSEAELTPAVFNRPECPFNYCDQEAPYAACQEHCRHRPDTAPQPLAVSDGDED